MKYLIGISAAVNIFLAGTGYVDSDTAVLGFLVGGVLILFVDFVSYPRCSRKGFSKLRALEIAGEIFLFSLLGVGLYYDWDITLNVLRQIASEPIVMAGSVAMSVMMVAINRSGINNIVVEEEEE